MEEIMYLIFVGLLWGITNPLIKMGSSGITGIQADNPVSKFIKELQFLIKNWKYMVPFLINQSGSLLYFFTLRTADLTIAVPITNSITFVVTAVTGWFLGESVPKPKTVLGSVLVVLGTACYMLDSNLRQEVQT